MIVVVRKSASFIYFPKLRYRRSSYLVPVLSATKAKQLQQRSLLKQAGHKIPNFTRDITSLSRPFQPVIKVPTSATTVVTPLTACAFLNSATLCYYCSLGHLHMCVLRGQKFDVAYLHLPVKRFQMQSRTISISTYQNIALSLQRENQLRTIMTFSQSSQISKHLHQP